MKTRVISRYTFNPEVAKQEGYRIALYLKGQKEPIYYPNAEEMISSGLDLSLIEKTTGI